MIVMSFLKESEDKKRVVLEPGKLEGLPPKKQAIYTY